MNTRGYSRVRAIFVGASCILLACAPRIDQASGVADTFAGTYILERRNNQPLPQAEPYTRKGRECRSVLYRSVLVLHPDSTYGETLLSAHGCEPEPLPSPQEVRGAGRIRWRGARGDTIELIDTTESLAFTQLGTFGPGTLHMVANGPDFKQPVFFHYRRAR